MWAVIRGAGPETIRVLLALGPVFIILTDHCVSSYVYNFYQTNNYNRLKGADPDLKDRKTHASSLHLAMDKGNEYAFRILLEKTKNLEDVNNKGISLLQLGKNLKIPVCLGVKLFLGTGKKSWMNDQLVHELEKRGLRRSRGIKRIISTHKKRMGFMFTISLAFIISGMVSI